jgi:hypothetical protein
MLNFSTILMLLSFLMIKTIRKTTCIYVWERLNVGTVPTYKMHHEGTVPTFKMHHVGTIKNQNQL